MKQKKHTEGGRRMDFWKPLPVGDDGRDSVGHRKKGRYGINCPCRFSHAADSLVCSGTIQNALIQTLQNFHTCDM